ncbi:SWIM zinc finger family protein [Hydrogenophaga sp.]|uniref:SWIM zinc finger family protein n=1 Tax=Hydrogenophaga sp. TaxID=1904254 RepID=UPI00351D4012
MMQPSEIEIEIEGSGGSIYRIKLYQTDIGLKTSCTCPAGQKKIHCKHRSAVFAGDFSQIRGEHPENLGSMPFCMELDLQHLCVLRAQCRFAWNLTFNTYAC